jgi:hypothetical protein
MMQMASFIFFAIGLLLTIVWATRKPHSKAGLMYSLGIIAWMAHGFVYYATLFICEKWGYKISAPPECIYQFWGLHIDFIFWSAVLRLHGAIAIIPTIYIVLRGGRWR